MTVMEKHLMKCAAAKAALFGEANLTDAEKARLAELRKREELREIIERDAEACRQAKAMRRAERIRDKAWSRAEG